MTVFRGALAMFAGLGALLLLPAAAQAAHYQVYKDALRGDAECKADSQCNLNFARVPAGKVLSIDNLSCFLRHKQGVGLFALQLVVQGPEASGNKRIFALTPNLQLQSTVNVSGENQNIWAVTDTIGAVATAGQRFQVYAIVRKGTAGTVGSVEQLSCGISGTLN